MRKVSILRVKKRKENYDRTGFLYTKTVLIRNINFRELLSTWYVLQNT